MGGVEFSEQFLEKLDSDIEVDYMFVCTYFAYVLVVISRFIFCSY